MASRTGLYLLIATSFQAVYVHSGLLDHLYQPHIINGTEARRTQIPYQARIDSDKKSFCGGSLISDRWVLTAAHCVDGYSVFSVSLGTYNHSQPDEPGRVRYTSRTSFFHDLYDKTSLNYDIGLILLPEAVKFSYHIKPIPVSPPSFKQKVFTGLRVRVSGWGKQKDGGTNSQTLKYADLIVISNLECFAKIGGNSVNEKVICATGRADTGSCYGDSGGPLVIRHNQKEVLLGALSFVSKLGCAGNPSGYTKLSYYWDWISNITGIPIPEE